MTASGLVPRHDPLSGIAGTVCAEADSCEWVINLPIVRWARGASGRQGPWDTRGLPRGGSAQRFDKHVKMSSADHQLGASAASSDTRRWVLLR
jgi:hypothetical protein